LKRKLFFSVALALLIAWPLGIAFAADAHAKKPSRRTLPVISKVLRTPEERFANLPDFPYSPRYTEVGGLRIAHIDEGPRDAPPILLMHGEPTWSFLYRKMIPVLVAAGFRVIVPDLVGFGRSDKPADKTDYSYLNYVLWMTEWMETNDLQHLTLFCQDWGSLIGLVIASESVIAHDMVSLAWLLENRRRIPVEKQDGFMDHSPLVASMANDWVVFKLGGLKAAIASDKLIKNDIKTVWDDRVLNHAYPIFGGTPKVAIQAANGMLPDELKKSLTEMIMV
jgi:hypothetical protein